MSGKYLSKEKTKAIKILLRRKSELEFRLIEKIGSEASLAFDRREKDALEVAIDALSEE